MLPAFAYDVLSREKFDKAFKDVVRRHRLEFLIYNRVVGEEQQVKSKPVAPRKLDLFSPKDMRREKREGARKKEICRVLHDAFTPIPNAYAPLLLSSARPTASAVGGMSPRPAASAVGSVSPRPTASAVGGTSTSPRPAASAAGGMSPRASAAGEMRSHHDTASAASWVLNLHTTANAAGGGEQWCLR